MRINTPDLVFFEPEHPSATQARRKAVAELLRSRRNELGRSRELVSAQSNINSDIIRKAEEGKYELKLWHAVVLCKVLNLDLQKLIDLTLEK